MTPPLGPLFGVFEGGGGVKIGEIGGVDRGVDFYFFEGRLGKSIFWETCFYFLDMSLVPPFWPLFLGGV